MTSRGPAVETAAAEEAAFVAAADPACRGPLVDGLVLDTSDGALGMRRLVDDMMAALPVEPLPPGVTVRDVPARDGVPRLRVYEPDERRLAGAGVLWVHGGGYVSGRVEYSDVSCAPIALAHGCPVVSVDYRLAPEHPYPAALEDCLAALRAVLDPASGLGIEPGRLVVNGSSAGGGLAAALGLLARDRGVEGIALLLLQYPMLDDRPGRPSMERATVRRTWHRDANAVAWAAYLGGRDDVPVHAAPGRATVEDLRGLPPVFVDVGTLDAFLDEDVDLATRCAYAGVPVQLVVTPGAYHGSEGVDPAAPTSRRILAARHDARERALRGESSPSVSRRAPAP